MHRLSAAKACFLSDSTEDTPEPDELLKTLDEVNKVQWGSFPLINSIIMWLTVQTVALFGFTRKFPTLVLLYWPTDS